MALYTNMCHTPILQVTGTLKTSEQEKSIIFLMSNMQTLVLWYFGKRDFLDL